MERLAHLAIILMTAAACGGRGADGDAPPAPPSEPPAAAPAPSDPAAAAPRAPAAEPQAPAEPQALAEPQAPGAEPQAARAEPAARADESATARAPAADPAQEPAAVREPAAATAQPAPAAAATPCGEKGQPACPLQAWMEKNLQKPLDDGDLEAVALGLGRVPKLVPDPSWNAGGDGWSTIAESGAAAAKRGDIDATKQSCKTCHKAWRRKYKEGFRHRPI